jgi:hypothetical protein
MSKQRLDASCYGTIHNENRLLPSFRHLPTSSHTSSTHPVNDCLTLPGTLQRQSIAVTGDAGLVTFNLHLMTFQHVEAFTPLLIFRLRVLMLERDLTSITSNGLVIEAAAELDGKNPFAYLLNVHSCVEIMSCCCPRTKRKYFSIWIYSSVPTHH